LDVLAAPRNHLTQHPVGLNRLGVFSDGSAQGSPRPLHIPWPLRLGTGTQLREPQQTWHIHTSEAHTPHKARVFLFCISG
jgi:hypothetical protein